MSSITSSYLQEIILGFILGTAYPSPPSLYLGFSSAVSVDLTGSTEITSSYVSARIPVSGFTTPSVFGSNVQCANTALLDWGTATANGSSPSLLLWDAASGGNLLMQIPLQDSLGASSPMIFVSGDPVTMAIGSLTLALDILSWSIWERTNQLNWLLGATHPAPYSTLYAGLHSSLDASGAGTELTAAIATNRIAIPSANWTAPTSAGNTKRISSSVLLAFGNSLATTANITKFGLWTAISGGNLLVHPALLNPYTVVAGKNIYIPANGLRLSAG